MLRFLVFTCMFGLIIGCENLPAPRHGAVDCTESKCTFTCESWTDMLGSPEIVCVDGEWNDKSPLCLTNLTKCVKMKNVKCPKMDHDEFAVGQELRNRISESELEILREVEDMLTWMKATRSKQKCFQQMCAVKCEALRSLRFCRACKRCVREGLKKHPKGYPPRDYVRCQNGGTLFGRK